MLLFSDDHPLRDSLLRLAEDHALPAFNVDDRHTGAALREALAQHQGRVLLATTLSKASAELVRIHRVDAQRACVVLLPSIRDAQAAWTAAYERPCPPVRLLRVDHNVAARPVYALRIAWGAAVPLVEDAAPSQAEASGLWARAKGAMKTAADVQRELRSDGPPWQLTVGSEALESRAGIVCGSKAVVPMLVGVALKESDGFWSGSGAAVSAESWKPLVCTPWAMQLAGAGALLVDDARRRVSAMDAVHVDAGPTVAVAIIA